MSTKSNTCDVPSADQRHQTVYIKTIPITHDPEENLFVTEAMITNAKLALDLEFNSDIGRQLGSQIILDNGTVIYETSNLTTFGLMHGEKRLFAAHDDAIVQDVNGFGVGYKPICVDIDGIPNQEIDVDSIVANGTWLVSTSNCDDINDICPFSYGVRADGKILNGSRADDWYEKTITKK